MPASVEGRAPAGIGSCPVTLEVRIFGAASLRLGSDRLRVEVAERPTAAEVLAAISLQHPALRLADSGARLAVNCDFVAPETFVAPHDEVALIAFVSGG